MDITSLLKRLWETEPDSITRVMAFMSYNPSIGRVFEGGGVKKFADIALKLVESLPAVRTIQDFDWLHKQFVCEIISSIRTSTSPGKAPSYGQAAKPINVFLKVYVDWASRPSADVRERLLPFLHVPLDSVLMKAILYEDEGFYKTHIRPAVRGKAYPYSIALVDETLYWIWQNYFRQLAPAKPLIFDIAWALYRDQYPVSGPAARAAQP